MKQCLSALLIAGMICGASAPVYAFNYEYESGADTKVTFGKPTQTDIPAYNPETENVRRNKDAAYLPPSYGIFSGEIPTDPSSPYHENSTPTRAMDITNYSQSLSDMGNLQTTSLFANTAAGDGTSAQSGVIAGGFLVSTSTMAESLKTMPLYYDDGSIGKLTIPSLKQTILIFEGETLDNMKQGAGHFAFTSAWDGNIGVAGHNRGSSGYFEGVKNLKNGDILIYETKYGTRTYAVYDKRQIADTDYSTLGWSQENTITLITCLENTPGMRISISARETV
jgi:sortase A